MSVEARLADLGLTLPPPSTPAANYVPYVVTGDTVHIAGQVPFFGSELRHVGKVGRDIDLEEAQKAAQLVGLNILSQLGAALDGDFSRVIRCIRLGGFVNCVDDFTQQPAVVNGASNLMVAVFGEAGRHARAAVGCSGLPLGVCVEIEGAFLIRQA